jgi:hypothetical protein
MLMDGPEQHELVRVGKLAVFLNHKEIWMARHRTVERQGTKKSDQDADGVFETGDPVVAAVLLMDALRLRSTKRRGDQVVFSFDARPGLARQVREIVKIAEESEQASVEIRARMDAALAADQSLT